MQAELHHFSVEDFERMTELGLFDNQRVELVRGLVLRMPGEGVPHVGVVRKLVRAFKKAMPSARPLRQHEPLTLADSVLEPDVTLVDDEERPRLVIEVAEGALAHDEAKVPVYAAAGVPELWLVDLVHRQVVLHTTPSPEGYAEVRKLGPDETVDTASAPCPVSISSLFAGL